jgi:hypothetical protein
MYSFLRNYKNLENHHINGKLIDLERLEERMLLINFYDDAVTSKLDYKLNFCPIKKQSFNYQFFNEAKILEKNFENTAINFETLFLTQHVALFYRNTNTDFGKDLYKEIFKTTFLKNFSKSYRKPMYFIDDKTENLEQFWNIPSLFFNQKMKRLIYWNGFRNSIIYYYFKPFYKQYFKIIFLQIIKKSFKKNTKICLKKNKFLKKKLYKSYIKFCFFKKEDSLIFQILKPFFLVKIETLLLFKLKIKFIYNIYIKQFSLWNNKLLFNYTINYLKINLFVTLKKISFKKYWFEIKYLNQHFDTFLSSINFKSFFKMSVINLNQDIILKFLKVILIIKKKKEFFKKLSKKDINFLFKKILFIKKLRLTDLKKNKFLNYLKRNQLNVSPFIQIIKNGLILSNKKLKKKKLNYKLKSNSYKYQKYEFPFIKKIVSKKFL